MDYHSVMLDIKFVEDWWDDPNFTAIEIKKFFILIYFQNNYRNELTLNICT